MRVQTYARIAGLLFLISLVAGGFGELYVPTVLIVSGDPTATAKNIVASDSLFRMGFASYLVEAICDIALTLILYVLLRPVGRELALLTVFFAFGGVGAILLGFQIFRSSYLPKLLGTLVALGGVGFVIRSFALALAPAS